MTSRVQIFEPTNRLEFGFRKQFSKADGFFFIESIRKSIDSINIVQTALLDHSKGFDSMSHDILKEKLKILGFQSDAPNLRIAFFLTDCNVLNKIRLTPTGYKLSELYPKELY